MADYIAYVAKDIFNLRGQFQHHYFSLNYFPAQVLQTPLSSLPPPPPPACHILQCPRGRASEVISSISWAFETRFHRLLSHAPALLSPNTRSGL